MAGNYILSVTAILFALFFLFFSAQLPPAHSPGDIGPGGWPSTILVLMLVLGVVLLVKTLAGAHLSKGKGHAGAGQGDGIVPREGTIQREGPGHDENETQREDGSSGTVPGAEAKPAEEDEMGRNDKHVLVAGLLVLYFLGVQYIGFVLATPVFVIVLARMLGMKKWSILVPASLLFSIFVIYLFPILLSIPLPRGVGIFREINLWIY